MSCIPVLSRCLAATATCMFDIAFSVLVDPTNTEELKITPRGNPLDTLCATLEQKMQFGEGERDLVM